MTQRTLNHLLLAVIVALAAFSMTGCSGFVADTMVKPHQSPLFDNPKNYGLAYEDVEFKAADGVVLSAWLIKGSKDKVIIQSHFGVQCNRAGYLREGKGLIKGWPTDVNFLRQAKHLNEKGYTVLMYDFRNHGNSGLGTNPWITWGLEESKDIIAAVDYISKHPDYSNADIGLLSICMGQAATTVAYGKEDGLKKYQNIKAMISVQPLDYPKFMAKLGMPESMKKGADKKIIKRIGIDLNKNTFMPYVKDIAVPTLVIQNKNDAFLDKELIDTYFSALTVEKEMLWLDLPKMKSDMHNRMAGYNWLGEQPEKLSEFFDKYVQ